MNGSGAVIGRSSKMLTLMRQVERLGRYRWPVLLLGETGTGKELIARALHAVEPQGAFVTIDCSSMVGPLMESELFGYARGAFTGATQPKTGLIEMAHGGTAFFDEIGELPLDQQVKLLRLLQEKEFRPVGGLSQRRSDFRIVAATNRDLQREVGRGTFRQDLYYRLSVVNLRLPPLRERQEDLVPLIADFLARYGRNHSIADPTLAILRAYPWPGNVRELENCIKHMVSVNSGPVLHDEDLPSAIRNHLAASSTRAMAAAVSGRSAFAIPPQMAQAHDTTGVMPLAEVERQAILRALEYTRGDRVMAANLLGIGRTTLYRKLKEYKVAV